MSSLSAVQECMYAERIVRVDLTLFERVPMESVDMKNASDQS